MLGNGEILIRQAGEHVLCQWQCDKSMWQRGIGEKHSSAKPICEQGNHLYDLIFCISPMIVHYLSTAMLMKPNAKSCFFVFLRFYRFCDYQFCFVIHWPDDIVQKCPTGFATFHACYSKNTSFPLSVYQWVDIWSLMMKWHYCFQSRNSMTLLLNIQNIIYQATAITNINNW